jgi:succinoglycan biosynthesis transport protein ExoP
VTPTPAPADDEIDLRQLGGALRRRWRWIGAGAGAGLLLAGLATLLQKPVWEGEFQIVLASEKQGSGLSALLGQNAALASLAGLGGGGGGGDGQETEVKILESPSVLLPVYEWIKRFKTPEQVEGLRFKTWVKGAVKVKAEKGTSVLNVSFRDTDKRLVLPATRRISQAYQDYSGRRRRQELTNLVSYLQEQINLIRPQVEASSRAAQGYAAEQGLGVVDGLPLSGTLSASGGATDGQSGQGAAVTIAAGQGGSLELRRTLAQQRITGLELQLRQAKAAGSQLLFIASETAARTDKGSTFDALTAIESQLAEKRSRLKQGDPLVQRLERERDALVGYINRQTIALLEGELAVARGNLASLERPKAVIQKHRELTQRALREETTLVELENNLAKFKLEQARETDPWDLISTPTLLDAPVSPRPARNLALGLLAGLVVGSGAALVADRRTGLVFAADELRQLLPYTLLASLDPAEPASWAASLELLAQGPLAGAVQVALVPACELEGALEVANQLQAALQAHDPAAQVLLSPDLQLAARCNAQLLLAAPGAASRPQVAQLQQNLLLQGRPVTGLLLLRDAS